MDELQRQHFMNFAGVVPVSLEMTSHHAFKRFPLQVRPGEGPRIQQDFAKVLGEAVPIPNPEMVELVSAKEQPLEAETVPRDGPCVPPIAACRNRKRTPP